MKATPSDEPFTIFIVDDDDGVIWGLSRLLRCQGYETQSFASSEEFLEKHDRLLPGCALLDLSVPGLELQQALTRNNGARRPIVFLTGRADILWCVRAMKAGAVDILTKPVDNGALLAAIAQAEQLDAELRRESTELSSIEERLSSLTRRELEVLGHVVTGRKNRQIASDLGTVEQTIKVHRARMMKKMKVRSIAELVRLAERAGVSMRTRGESGQPFLFTQRPTRTFTSGPVALTEQTEPLRGPNFLFAPDRSLRGDPLGKEKWPHAARRPGPPLQRQG
jgi:FixJ family two-component response regulator